MYYTYTDTLEREYLLTGKFSRPLLDFPALEFSGLIEQFLMQNVC